MNPASREDAGFRKLRPLILPVQALNIVPKAWSVSSFGLIWLCEHFTCSFTAGVTFPQNQRIRFSHPSAPWLWHHFHDNYILVCSSTADIMSFHSPYKTTDFSMLATNLGSSACKACGSALDLWNKILLKRHGYILRIFLVSSALPNGTLSGTSFDNGKCSPAVSGYDLFRWFGSSWEKEGAGDSC